MEPSSRVTITDRDGWQKTFSLEKSLIQVGSDARNDIVLDVQRGGGVAGRHLQLIAARGPQPGYRIVNLGDQPVVLDEAQENALAPHAFLEVADGQRLRLGEYVLAFQIGVGARQAERDAVGPVPVRGPEAQRPTQMPGGGPEAQPPAESSSGAIKLRLSLPNMALEPDWPMEGIITVRNVGNEPGVQFRLEVEGLLPECCEIGPAPILFPNVEKKVTLRLHHPRGRGPAAGQQQIRIRASAPDAYPGETVVVSREIEILPYRSHSIRLYSVDG